MALANQQGLSDKFVSERHHHASQTKLTAGQVATKLRKMKLQITAKEVVEAYQIIKGYLPEWHHSGFYKPTSRSKSKMGRTYFFKSEDIDIIFNDFHKVAEKRAVDIAEHQRKISTATFGFYYVWDSSGSGRYKKNYKALKWYSGNEAQTPPNFTACSEEVYTKNSHLTTSYYGWSEPSLADFQ